MPSKGNKKRPLTEDEKHDCALLAAKWDDLKAAGKPLSQKQLAATYGATASLVSQFLRGYIALNETWKLRFAQYMGLAPQDIWPDWPYKALTAGPVPPSLEPIRRAWQNMTPEEQLALTTLALRGRNPP